MKPDHFTAKFYQKFREDLTPSLLKHFPKNCIARETSKLILSGHYHHDTKTRHRSHKENYRPISLMNIDVENLNKYYQSESNNTLKNIIYHDQMGFTPEMQEFYNVCKSINVIHRIKKLNNKNHMIISVDAEKGYDKIKHPFMIKKKIPRKVGILGTYLNFIKAIYNKLTVNIILKVEKPKAFPLRSGTKQGCPLPPLLFTYFCKS